MSWPGRVNTRSGSNAQPHRNTSAAARPKARHVWSTLVWRLLLTSRGLLVPGERGVLEARRPPPPPPHLGGWRLQWSRAAMGSPAMKLSCRMPPWSHTRSHTQTQKQTQTQKIVSPLNVSQQRRERVVQAERGPRSA